MKPGSDFEDWLWKREKPKHPGQLADLRSRATFPGSIDLPNENDVDLDFYESRDMVGVWARASSHAHQRRPQIWSLKWHLSPTVHLI